MNKFTTLIAVLWCLSGSAQAQTLVNNPTVVTFTASVDHNTIWTPAPGQDGTAGPVLTSYLLVIQENGTTIRTTDIGKPTPSATNVISTPLTMTGLAQGRTYLALVVASGPGGTSASTPSGPFVWPVTTLLPPAGATNVIVVGTATTSANCTDVPLTATQIVDTAGAVWTIGPQQQALKNGVQYFGGLVSELLWAGGQLYARGGPDPLNWYRVTTTGYVSAVKPTCTTP